MSKSKNRKAASAVIAVVAAAVILLTGTFAWQSISQTALNEAGVNLCATQADGCTTISTA
ncbi:MAG: hypothetical protein ACLR23_05600 [Clostridia bacterium]